MTSRASFLIAAAAATALAAASFSARAAMPVGSAQPSINSDLKLVQDQAATPKKPARKSKRQKEIDSSVESRTVPKRYQTNVPKEYHHLIPWAK